MIWPGKKVQTNNVQKLSTAQSGRITFMDAGIKNKLLSEMESYFGMDKIRISHAYNVMAFAERVLEGESSAETNELVIIAAAVLHDIGIHVCEKKYNSTAGHLQEKEGPPIARKIMKKLEFKKETVNEVCRIIASHHSPGEVNTENFNIVSDADWLVNMPDEAGLKDKANLKRLIDKVMLTKTGKAVAVNMYLQTE